MGTMHPIEKKLLTDERKEINAVNGIEQVQGTAVSRSG